jgi:hypothetical protein
MELNLQEWSSIKEVLPMIRNIRFMKLETFLRLVSSDKVQTRSSDEVQRCALSAD